MEKKEIKHLCETKSIYTPELAEVIEVIPESTTIVTLRMKFIDEKIMKNFSFRPGQFILVSVFGQGEIVLGLSSGSYHKDHIDVSINKLGRVSQAMHRLNVGDTVGVRGPYGNWFPIDKMKGKELLLIGGGCGIAPLRSLLFDLLENKENFEKITLLYGARSVADLPFKEDCRNWEKNVEAVYTVDPGGESPDWKGKVGFVPAILEQMKPNPKNKIVVTCGPPIMIKFVNQVLEKYKFDPEQIITTLEMKMKCGLGKCGRCNIGELYVCKDGPIFTYKEVKEFFSNEF